MDEKITCWNCKTSDICAMHSKDCENFYHFLQHDKREQLMREIAEKCRFFSPVE